MALQRNPVLIGIKSLRILASLAGVRLASQAVHGDSHGLVGFPADGAEGHRARLEALHDEIPRLTSSSGTGRGALFKSHDGAERGVWSFSFHDQVWYIL
jgi:hypothetical protein